MDHKYVQIYVNKMKWNLKTLHVVEFSGHFLLQSPMENNIGKCYWVAKVLLKITFKIAIS